MSTLEVVGVITLALLFTTVLGRFVWVVWRAATVTQEMKSKIAELTLHVTNHIPHRLDGLRNELHAVAERLSLHEEREEKHWELLTKVLTTKNDKR